MVNALFNRRYNYKKYFLTIINFFKFHILQIIFYDTNNQFSHPLHDHQLIFHVKTITNYKKSVTVIKILTFCMQKSFL